MNNLIKSIALLTILAAMTPVPTPAAAKSYDYQQVAADPMHTRIYTLDNGMKVYLSQNKEKPRIQTYIAVRTGGRNDPKETTGLAHYLEHLMFKGTDKFGTTDMEAEQPYLDKIEALYEEYRTIKDSEARKQKYHEIDSVSQLAAQYNIPNEYDKLMTAIGGIGTNAWTSDDCTNYTEDIPSNEIENWAKIQSDRFKNMVIRGFHTELEAVYEEYNMGLSSDGSKAYNAMRAKLYPTHPYGTQTVIGTQEHLKNPSIVNIKKYFRQYYCPNNMAICMSGDFDFDEVMNIIDKYFGDMKTNPDCTYPYFAPVADLTSVNDTTVVGLEAETILMGWKFENAASRQTDTLEVVEKLLSNGKAGLIDIDLNQQMKLIDGAGGYYAERDYTTFMMEGTPKEGQTLEEVRDLLLGEIDRLRRGDWDEKMITAAVNNLKLIENKQMEDNSNRARKFVDAFVYGQDWNDVVNRIGRISKITKQDVMDFVGRHFRNNYVVVYKRQGEDTNLKKIDKPTITPIPSNRDKESDFVTEIKNAKTKEIGPRFADFEKDMSTVKTKKGLDVLYVKNTDNDIFTLAFRFPFGNTADKRWQTAVDYAEVLGTDKKSAAQLQQELYELACQMRLSANNYDITMTITGLSENASKALAIAEDFISNMKVDQEAWQKFVDVTIKARTDEQLSQEANFTALELYGEYGGYNEIRNTLTNKELKATDPASLVDMIKQLKSYQHEVLYYGPMTTGELTAMIDRQHKTAKKLKEAPAYKEYNEMQTPENEVYIAPYDAKNLYMALAHNEGTQYSPEHQAVISLFNEYFGGGMNSIVFQEMRETRGLAYSAGGNYYAPVRKGHSESAGMTVITQNDKLNDCISTFGELLNKMPQSEQAFQLAKQSLTKRLQTRRTTKFDIIRLYLTFRNRGYNYDINRTVYEQLPSLTMQDIVKFANENLANKPWRYIILADEKNIDMEMVEKLGKVKKLSRDEIFGY